MVRTERHGKYRKAPSMADNELERLLSQPTVSVPEAGRLLSLSRNGSYEAAKRGEIPTLRFGSKLRVPTAALRKMIEGAAPTAA
jgi:excisionase family DNA binding protein